MSADEKNGAPPPQPGSEMTLEAPPRRPGRPPQMTAKRQEFVRIATEDEGVGLARAARLAGFTDGARELDRLLSDPAICGMLLRKIQPRLARFERLMQRAWDALDYNLDPDNWEPVESGPNGRLVFPVTGADRVASAALVFRTLEQVDPDLLAMRARQADAKTALRDLAKHILTESTPAQEGLDAPEGPAADGPPLLDPGDEGLTLPPEPPTPGEVP